VVVPASGIRPVECGEHGGRTTIKKGCYLPCWWPKQWKRGEKRSKGGSGSSFSGRKRGIPAAYQADAGFDLMLVVGTWKKDKEKRK